MSMAASPAAGTTTPPPAEPVIPKRRNTELVLLVVAYAFGMLAYADLGEVRSGKLPGNYWTVGLGFGVLLFVAHLAVRWLAPYADPLILPLAAALNGFGLVLISRLDPYNIANHFAPKSGNAGQQAWFSAIGVIVLIAVLFIVRDHKVLQRYAYISALVGLILIALPAVLPSSLAPNVNGARSWIKFAGLSVQPAEFGKLFIVSFFAAYLHATRDTLALASRKVLGIWIPRGRDMGPLVVCWAFAMLVLIRETDLGVSLMFFGVFVVMLYLATERASWLIFGLLLFVLGAALVAMMFSHVQVRFDSWLNPFGSVSGNSRQTAQSLYAFANGGLFGTGLGQGYPYLVGFANNADFVMDTVGEEFGLVGLTAILIAYALFVARGLKTALLVRDPYGKLFASGLAVVFALQVFITAGGVMRVIPLTGLPMPFLAYGGSALLANWILAALLLRVSDAARRPLPPALPLTAPPSLLDPRTPPGNSGRRYGQNKAVQA